MTLKEFKMLEDILTMAKKDYAKINRLAKRSGESTDDLMADFITILEELRREK